LYSWLDLPFPKEVALYSFTAFLSGFFAGNFAGISSLIKVHRPTPFFFATSFFGGIGKKKVARKFIL
jgi:hypothetical protein